MNVALHQLQYRIAVTHIDMSVTNHAQIFEGVCAGELYDNIKERGQIADYKCES